MEFKPLTNTGYTTNFWIKQLKNNNNWEVVIGKYWDGTKWVIFSSEYAGVGKGDVCTLTLAGNLNYTVRAINFLNLETTDESLVASANINAIVRGDFNSLALVNPKEVDLNTITFQLSPSYWTIYNYQASDFELVGAMGETLVATAIDYNPATKTFTLTFPSIEHINPAPNLNTRLFMRSGTITNVFGTVLDESYVTFETTYMPEAGIQTHTNSLEATANLDYVIYPINYSEQMTDDESLTASAMISAQVRDINETIILEI